MSDGTSKISKKKKQTRETSIELDLEVASLDANQKEPEMFDDKQKVTSKTIRTLADLQTQIVLARNQGTESLEITKELMSQIVKDPKSQDVGYITYNSIRVYEEGKREKADQKDQRSQEEAVFSESKVQMNAYGVVTSGKQK